jgi:hypothetical protein
MKNNSAFRIFIFVADRVPVRTMYLATGLFKDYSPEFSDL